MRITELPLFARHREDLLSEEEFGAFRTHIAQHPESGVLLQGGAGLRKVRWAALGKGKSGGVRIIYYWDRGHGEILLLLIYAKNVQENLTATQLKQLRTLMKELKS